MSEDLTQDERAELERLRAEKRDRERELERAELERLRVESRRLQAEAETDAHIEATRQKGREFMLPDEDLRMSRGHKLALGAVLGITLLWVFFTLIR